MDPSQEELDAAYAQFDPSKVDCACCRGYPYECSGELCQQLGLCECVASEQIDGGEFEEQAAYGYGGGMDASALAAAAHFLTQQFQQQSFMHQAQQQHFMGPPPMGMPLPPYGGLMQARPMYGGAPLGMAPMEGGGIDAGVFEALQSQLQVGMQQRSQAQAQQVAQEMALVRAEAQAALQQPAAPTAAEPWLRETAASASNLWGPAVPSTALGLGSLGILQLPQTAGSPSSAPESSPGRGAYLPTDLTTDAPAPAPANPVAPTAAGTWSARAAAVAKAPATVAVAPAKAAPVAATRPAAAALAKGVAVPPRVAAAPAKGAAVQLKGVPKAVGPVAASPATAAAAKAVASAPASAPAAAEKPAPTAAPLVATPPVAAPAAEKIVKIMARGAPTPAAPEPAPAPAPAAPVDPMEEGLAKEVKRTGKKLGQVEELAKKVAAAGGDREKAGLDAAQCLKLDGLAAATADAAAARAAHEAHVASTSKKGKGKK